MSHQQHLLGHVGSHSGEVLGGDDQGPNSGSDVVIEEVMITTQSAGDTPSASITHKSAATPPGEKLAQVMDVDKPPGSPISPKEDDLLTGATEVGVEMKMATLSLYLREGGWR